MVENDFIKMKGYLGDSFPGGASGKEPSCPMQERQEMRIRSLGQEEGVATCSSILAWRFPWTEESGGLQSIWSQRVRHKWSDLACTLFWNISETIKKGLKRVAGWGVNRQRESCWQPHFPQNRSPHKLQCGLLPCISWMGGRPREILMYCDCSFE